MTDTANTTVAWMPGRAYVVGAVLAACLALALLVAPAADAQFGLAPADGVLPGAVQGEEAWWAGTCDLANPDDVADGSDPAGTPDDPMHCIDFGTFGTAAPPTLPAPWHAPPAWRLAPVAEAGAHPDATAAFYFNSRESSIGESPVDNVRSVLVDIPAGVVGNPIGVDQCSQEGFGASPQRCPASSQVGVSTLRLRVHTANDSTGTRSYPVYNLEPRRGYTAELGIPDIGYDLQADIGSSIRIFAKARSDGDFGVTTGVMAIPTQWPLIAQALTIWGVPFAASHDPYRLRAPVPSGGGAAGDSSRVDSLSPDEQAPYEPGWGPIRPFFTNPTECDPVSPLTRLNTTSYQNPGGFVSDGLTPDGRPNLADPNWLVYDSEADPVVECGTPGFEPASTFTPTSTAAGSASGLNVDIGFGQNDVARDAGGAPLVPPAEGASQVEVDAYVAAAIDYFASAAGRATSQLDRTTVTLPAGMTVNPSTAAGLRGCTDAQVGLTAPATAERAARFNNSDPFDGDASDGVECPQSSVIGTVSAKTPLLDETLTGEFVLGQPTSTDPASGGMLRTFLVLRNRDRGLIAKVLGTARIPDGVRGEGGSGRVVATFDKNPRVPVESIEVAVKGGARGAFGMPASCGPAATVAQFAPWTAAHGTGVAPVDVTSPFAVGGDCGPRFAPSLAAAMSSRQARTNGTFSFRFARGDADQRFQGLTATLPRGLLASVRGVPLCSNAQANAGACPLGSQIGVVDAKAGSGDPFVLEQKGRVYLTEGYKGGEYGLMVRVRAIAGPFRGALELSPIVVRQAIHVDRRTAEVTAVSDPFPQVWHGVPLRVREITVNVDRDRFMLNPSDCSAKQVQATILSAGGAAAGVANHFQASNCADLRFKPRLRLALKGRRQVRTGKHPAIRAVVRQQGISEAGIAKAEVRLPKSLALDVNNAQELCEFDDGTKPDLENHCPKGSIVGRARAKTPLLNDDLVGDVYFVKNVRIDEDTGNEIRTLPMIVVALRGEIAVNLVGESDTTRSGKLVNTFDNVPDAPITRFNLNIAGGKNGILAVTRTRRARINLCAKPGSHIAEADMDGQNGKRHDFNVRMTTPCRNRRQSAAKVCRKRTDTKPAFRRCVTKVKRNRAQKRRAAQKRKAAKRSDGAGGASRG